jgi:hypothetical protein
MPTVTNANKSGTLIPWDADSNHFHICQYYRNYKIERLHEKKNLNIILQMLNFRR